MPLPSGVQLIWQPSPVCVQVFFAMSQTPVSRFEPRSVMATNLPSGESSGCCRSTPSRSVPVLSTTTVSLPEPSLVRRIFPFRTKTISSSDTQLPQLALSTTLAMSDPSGFTVKMSHLSARFASRSLTQPLLLRQKRIFEPSGEKRGNQSTFSPFVICFTFDPSVFIVKRSWLPSRELDQTIVPVTFLPMAFICADSASSIASSDPFGGAPVIAEHPQTMHATIERLLYPWNFMVDSWFVRKDSELRAPMEAESSARSLRARRSAG